MTKAIIYRKYGKSDVLKLEDVQLPDIAKDEVRLAVHAAGVNPVDWKIRKGLLKWIPIYRLPIQPGMDVSGQGNRRERKKPENWRSCFWVCEQ